MNDSVPESNSTLFYWKDFAIEQDDRVWKAGTDAILLGTWIPKILHDANLVLDIGTGSGILLCMLARSFPQAKLTGIDNFPQAVELASRNASNSLWPDRIEVIESSLHNFALSPTKRFDLILSNPPFFTGQVKSPVQHRFFAKHTSIEPEHWLCDIRKLLVDHGSACLILPHPEMKEWIKAANDIGLYVKNRLDIFSFKHDAIPKRVLVQLTRKLVRPRTSKMVMYADEKIYAEEYATWIQT